MPAATKASAAIDVVLWVVAIACVLITVGFSLIPPPELAASTMSDKVQHAIAYFFTTGFLLLAAAWRPGRAGDQASIIRRGLLIYVGSIAVGGLLEIVQGFLPNRQMAFGDWVADAIGSALAFGLWMLARNAAARRIPAE